MSRLTFAPFCCHSRTSVSVVLKTLALSAPHSPRSVEMTRIPTARGARATRYGWLESACTCFRCAISRRAMVANGRARRMRSWARPILLAATISSALVIFCVLLTLAILVRISLVPGMSFSGSLGRSSGGEAARGGEAVADPLQRRLVLLQHRLGIDGIQ